jgi:hypothetical protein
MKKLKWIPLLLAVIGTICLISIGISIAEGSTLGICVSIVLLILIMGIGFMTKKKMRENGTL